MQICKSIIIHLFNNNNFNNNKYDKYEDDGIVQYTGDGLGEQYGGFLCCAVGCYANSEYCQCRHFLLYILNYYYYYYLIGFTKYRIPYSCRLLDPVRLYYYLLCLSVDCAIRSSPNLLPFLISIPLYGNFSFAKSWYYSTLTCRR